MNKNTIAWIIAVGGIALEIFIASLDFWFDEIPHLVLHIGDGKTGFMWR